METLMVRRRIVRIHIRRLWLARVALTPRKEDELHPIGDSCGQNPDANKGRTRVEVAQIAKHVL